MKKYIVDFKTNNYCDFVGVFASSVEEAIKTVEKKYHGKAFKVSTRDEKAQETVIRKKQP